MLALIDGDIVAYRTAAANENANEGLARWQADQMMLRILEETNATDWKVYLSGEHNFRYSLYPAYKANRVGKPRPKFLEPIREHLLLEWKAVLTNGIEADDALGIARTPQSIICSIDKDLLQIPGIHYHFVDRRMSTVSDLEGIRQFYRLLLIGDVGDNIPGCPGIGKVKAERNLEYASDTLTMYEICKRLYAKAGVSLEQMHINAKLLYVWRKEDDEWQPPEQAVESIKQEAETPLEFLPKMTNISTESGMEKSGTPPDGALTDVS